MFSEAQPLLIATGNDHKVREIAAVLTPLGVCVARARSFPEIEESGSTFAENARDKAVSAAKHLSAPVCSDDSGLVVYALDGAPGVRSARYASDRGRVDASSDRNVIDLANNALLVDTLKSLGVEDPKAAFVCHIVIAGPDGSIWAEAEGRVEGVIRWPALGSSGFGYDPHFHYAPANARFSELTAAEKNEVSHRGQALRELARVLKSGLLRK